MRPLVEPRRKPSRLVVVGRRPAGISPTRPIRPLHKTEFDRMARQVAYYRSRWNYTSVACSLAGELIERDALRSALELGPHLRSIIVGADVMDRRRQPQLESEGTVIVHDARVTPWPVADKTYDLFVGLQVFEHLGDAQPAAFREVRRIARHAIISLPIDWDLDDPTDLHHRIPEARVLSWFAPVVPDRVVPGSPEPRKRLVYVFENLEPEPDWAPVATPPASAAGTAIEPDIDAGPERPEPE